MQWSRECDGGCDECCSYKDESDFRQPGGYFDDMCNAALADLQSKVDAYRRYL